MSDTQNPLRKAMTELVDVYIEKFGYELIDSGLRVEWLDLPEAEQREKIVRWLENSTDAPFKNDEFEDTPTYVHLLEESNGALRILNALAGSDLRLEKELSEKVKTLDKLQELLQTMLNIAAEEYACIDCRWA